MTDDQIIKWAREAGFHKWYSDPEREYHFGCVKAFAAIVRNAALEEASTLCDAWIADHSKADNCTYADCDMVAVATDLANEIRGMKP